MESSDETRQPKSNKNSNLLIFGEILYDCFPDGKKVLGGAPFNVAWNLSAFNKRVSMVSAVGDDQEGGHIIEKATAWGIDPSGIYQSVDYATGRVRVEIIEDEPQYEILKPRAWDFIPDQGASASGLIYFGSLALRTEENRKTLGSILNRSSARKFVDLNVRKPHFDLNEMKKWIRNIDWLKINIDELKILSEKEAIKFSNCETVLKEIHSAYSVENILLTAGSEGAAISADNGEVVKSLAPVPTDFKDTVGAGDSLASVAIYGILENWDSEEILERGLSFASSVCGLNGATTENKNFYKKSWLQKRS